MRSADRPETLGYPVTGPPARKTAAPRATVLVVDDESTIRKLLERILTRAGYRVVASASGHEAVERMGRGGIDLVLLDIMMPEFDGFQTLREMRRQPCAVPVIMVTGKGEVGTLREALGIGADDFVRKPFSRVELLARIRAKLRRAGAGGL